jgi:hypothetical protein
MSKRGKFQIHLSTAIVLMFVAGTLLWVNVSEQHLLKYEHVRGFPYWFYYSHEIDVGDGKSYTPVAAGFHWFTAIVDLVLNIVIIYVVYLVVETIIYRREDHKAKSEISN